MKTTEQISEIPNQINQIIFQTIIPERPSGLIGEKVVFSDKYVQKFPDNVKLAYSRVNTPYFTIIGAKLEMREKGITVMINPDIPGTQWKSYGINLIWFKKYESSENSNNKCNTVTT